MMKYEYNREKVKQWFDDNTKDVVMSYVSSDERLLEKRPSLEECDKIEGTVLGKESIWISLNFNDLCVQYSYSNHDDEIKAREMSADITKNCLEKKKRR